MRTFSLLSSGNRQFHWKKTERFTKWWTRICFTLQIFFQSVTGKPLAFSLKRAGLLQYGFALLLSAVVVSIHVYQPYWPVWRLSSFLAVVLHLTACSTFRTMTFSALQITSATLVTRFKVINITSVIFALC